jgi:hypothetical protein
MRGREKRVPHEYFVEKIKRWGNVFQILRRKGNL